MEVSVSMLRFVFVAGIVSLATAGGPYFPFEGCLEELDWVHFGDACYKFLSPDGGRSYAEMYSMCETEGPYKHPVGLIAYLADVQSQAENDFIAQNVTGGARAWLGAERVGDDFRWIANVRNGNEEPGLSYTNWKQNEPNNSSGDEDCIEINRGRAGAGTWNDLKCKRKISGVCKYSISEWIEGRE